jgi:hypothetical protein
MAFVRFYYEFLNKLKIGFFAKVRKIIEKMNLGCFCAHMLGKGLPLGSRSNEKMFKDSMGNLCCSC